MIGCGILLYPHILQIFYKIKTESMFRQFEETTENVRDANPEKYARLYEEMKNYNEELIKTIRKISRSVCICKPGNPFGRVRVENGIAGYIKIPVMDLSFRYIWALTKKICQRSCSAYGNVTMPPVGIIRIWRLSHIGDTVMQRCFVRLKN